MFDTLTDTDLLAEARGQRATADAAEVRLLELACAWAEAHPPRDLEAIGTYTHRGGETPFSIAGPGCPLVAEFAVAEFAAALGLGAESGKHLIGQALELTHRLPHIWARVKTGQVQAWRARRVAEATLYLSPDAVAHVDRHLAPVAHSAKAWQLDRLVADAIARHMPDLAADQRRDALDRRHVTIETNQTSIDGTCWLTGELDLADARDLDTALTTGAQALKAGGSTDSLDVRRSLALGELARGQGSLDLATDQARSRPQRKVTLHLHLAEDAVSGWVEEGRLPVTADTIRDWCGTSHVVVKPVIDLNDHQASDSYAVPDRIKDHVTIRDRTCVFPYCTRPARHLDCDHIQSHDTGGPTCTCNLAALCRTHHRVKTHDHRGQGWTYTALEPGTYLWRSPIGLTFIRDPRGTTDLTPDTWPQRD